MSSSLLLHHLEECSDCFPIWDQCAFYDNEHEDEIRLIKQTRRRATVGNCVTLTSLVFSDVTKGFLKMAHGGLALMILYRFTFLFLSVCIGVSIVLNCSCV